MTSASIGARWAIVVGISKYRHAQLNLEYADRDAREFCELIKSPEGGGFKPENVVLLVNEDATTRNVTGALRTFLKKPDRQDLVVIYFACHGSPDPERPGNVYLLTHDVDPADLAGTAVPMREIDLALRENLLADRVVIIADTCHSAAMGGGPGRRAAANSTGAVNEYLRRLSVAHPGVALLTSAEANEVSYEDEKWGGGHGVFTHFLLEGMRGAAADRGGIVTVGELFEYVRENVKIATDHRQHPAIGTTKFDRRLPMAAPGNAKLLSEHAGTSPAELGSGGRSAEGTQSRSGEASGLPSPSRRRRSRIMLAGALPVIVVTTIAAFVYRTWDRTPPAVAGKVVYSDGPVAATSSVEVIDWNRATTTDSQGTFQVSRPSEAARSDSVTLTIAHPGVERREEHRVALAMGQIVRLRHNHLGVPDTVVQVLRRLRSFNDFKTDTATLKEARRILLAVGLSKISETTVAVSGSVDSWRITLWPRSHNEATVFGLRYQPETLGNWNEERTLERIVIPAR